MQTQEIALPFYEQILDFLATGPSARAIVAFRPSAETQKRFSQLLDANRNCVLTPAEVEELDHYIRIERMISLLKAKAYRRLQIRGNDAQSFGNRAARSSV